MNAPMILVCVPVRGRPRAFAVADNLAQQERIRRDLIDRDRLSEIVVALGELLEALDAKHQGEDAA